MQSKTIHNKIAIVTEGVDMKAPFMGDGTGAIVFKRLKESEEGLLAFHLMARECEKAASMKISGAYGNYSDNEFEIRPFVYIEPESFPRDIPWLEKYVPYSIEQSINAVGLTIQDVNLFVLGQQYLHLNKTWSYNLGISYDKVHDTLSKTACLKNEGRQAKKRRYCRIWRSRGQLVDRIGCI